MKQLRGCCKRPRGFVLLEAFMGVMLVGLVLALVSMLVAQYARATDHFLNHRRVQLAAEARIEQMRTGRLPMAEVTQDGPNGITIDVHIMDTDDAWAPLRLVRVTAVAPCKHGRSTSYTLAAYISPTAPVGSLLREGSPLAWRGLPAGGIIGVKPVPHLLQTSVKEKRDDR